MINRTAADWVSLLSITHKVTETRLGEGSEIGIRDRDNQLLAVITHPMPGAKWFVHWADPQDTILLAEAIIDGEASEFSPRAKMRFGFRTKKRALQSVHHGIQELEARAEQLTET
jgi:hypothetical protein